MGRRPDNWCQIGIVKAIKKAVPGFNHKCTCTAHLAVYVRGSRVNQYCKAVNGTKSDLLPTGKYRICREMAVNVFDKTLNKNLSVRTTKIDSNNITTTRSAKILKSYMFILIITGS